MTNEQEESARLAAMVAREILQQAEDGTKLLSVTYNYPRGAKAMEFGFCFGVGIAIAITLLSLIQKLIGLVLP